MGMVLDEATFSSLLKKTDKQNPLTMPLTSMVWTTQLSIRVLKRGIDLGSSHT